MRTTSRLVKWNVVSFIEPIREGVRKKSLMYKFVMFNCQSLILIGLTNELFMTLTNQKLCLKAGRAQGVKAYGHQHLPCSHGRLTQEQKLM